MTSVANSATVTVQSPPAAPTDEDDVTFIVVGVVGGFVAIVTAVALVYCCYCKKRNAQKIQNIELASASSVKQDPLFDVIGTTLRRTLSVQECTAVRKAAEMRVTSEELETLVALRESKSFQRLDSKADPADSYEGDAHSAL